MLDSEAFACAQMTASGTLKSTPGRLWGVFIKGVSTPHDVIVRDGGVSGTIKYKFSPPNSGATCPDHSFQVPIRFNIDIYVEYANGTNIPTSSFLYE